MIIRLLLLKTLGRSEPSNPGGGEENRAMKDTAGTPMADTAGIILQDTSGE